MRDDLLEFLDDRRSRAFTASRDYWRPSAKPRWSRATTSMLRKPKLPDVDVLMVLHDGGLVVGECKRRGTGLREADIEKLDRVADRIGARWSFLATTSWAGDCPEIWQEAARSASEGSPRFVLTAALA